MEYEELTIEVRSTKAGFEAAVTRAPRGGRQRIDFEPPFAVEELAGLAARADGLALRKVVARRDVELDDLPEPLPAEEVGERLSAALFRAGIAWCWAQSTAVAGEGMASGLRLRIAFTQPERRLRFLASLPWELLVHQPSGAALARSAGLPLVRDLGFPWDPRPRLSVRRFRLLVVDSCPKTLGALDLELEGRRIARVLDANPVFELERVSGPSREELRDRLRDGEPFHGLHFMGHGELLGGEGSVYLEGDDGELDPLTGDDLAEMLAGLPALRLVVLNACNTASFSGPEGSNPYLGVAAAIVRRCSIPAVVAMQRPIADDAAIAFSETLYEALGKMLPVETAVSQARARLAEFAAEWATPVLYLQAEDGRLFELDEGVGSGAAEEAGPPSDGSPPGPDLLRVGVRSFVTQKDPAAGPEVFGRADDLEQDVELFLGLEEHFDGRVIRRPALWHERIYPRLRDFLLDVRKRRRPLELHLPAHASIALAVGYVLEATSGLDVTVVQPQRGGESVAVRPFDGLLPDGGLWEDQGDTPRDQEAEDVAVAVSLTHDVLEDVKSFVDDSGLRVARILRAKVKDCGYGGLKGGDHALRLAQELARRIESRPAAESRGTVHLFYSGPNAFAFYLGQLLRGFGVVQMYEYPRFGGEGAFGLYEPSLRFPPPRTK